MFLTSVVTQDVKTRTGQGGETADRQCSAEVLRAEESLAAAEAAEEVTFLRTQLEQLYKERVSLREKENLLLRVQQGGEHFSPSHYLPSS